MRGAGPAERRVLILNVHTTGLDLGVLVNMGACVKTGPLPTFVCVFYVSKKLKVNFNAGMGRIHNYIYKYMVER